MLDGLKGWSGSGRAERQGNELETLIVAAREERAALSALLAQISLRAAKLPQMDASLQEFGGQVAALTGKLAEVSAVVQRLDDRAAVVRGLEQRTDALVGRLNEVQRVVEQLTAEHADLQEFRAELGEITTETTTLHASLASLQEGNRALDQDLHASRAAVQESLALSERVGGELEQVRAAAVELADRYAALTDGTRQARDEAAAAAVAAADAAATVRDQVSAVEQLKELDRSTTDKLRALRGIADEVERKIAALREQQPLVEHALAQNSQVQAMAATAAELSRTVQALQQQKPAIDETMSRVAHLAEIAASVERLASHVDEARARAAQSKTTADAVAGTLDTLRSLADQLNTDYAGMRESSADARAQAAAAAAAAADAAASLREKVAAMERLHDAGRSADDSVRQLLGAAGEADRKAALLLQQQPALDRAVQQVARLDEVAAVTAELGRSIAALQQQKPQVDDAVSRVAQLDAAATGLASAVERLQRDVEDARTSAQRSGGIADEVNSGLETLRTSVAQLARDYAALRDASSESQTQAAAAAAAAADAASSVREKVAAIDRLHELGRSTDEKVRQLVTLADQADRRTSFLLDQQPLVERVLEQFPLVQDLAGTTAELARSVSALQQQQPRIDAAVAQVARLGDVADTIERLRLQADGVRDGVADAKAVAGDVSHAVGTVRAMATQLAQEYAGLRDVSRQARDEAAAATAAATEAAASVREKLAAMEMLNHLGRATDEKLRGLKTIAEQVDHQAIELQAQQPLVDRALAQAAHVQELSAAAAALTRSVAALREQQPRVEEALSRAAQVDDMAATLQRLVTQIEAAHAGIADNTGLAADVQTEVNGIRLAVTQLASDFGGLRESARHSAEQARAAAEGVLTVRQKLGEVEAIAALRRTVDEQFAQLTTIADDASRTLTALHAFQPSHEVAVEHARELAGLNVEAAARIETINAGLARAARLDTLLQRLEALEAETDARVQSVAVVRDTCARAVQSAEDDTRSLIRSLDTEVQRISGQVAGLKSDVDVVDRQRAALDALRHDVEQLTGRTRQAEQHAAALMTQRAAIVDMETNLTFLTRLLNSVRADLKSIVERKDVIDGFAQKVSSVELALQHAQHVLGTLQSERQLAERIEQSLRQLRTRAT